MATGPGKYDDLCGWVREKAEAEVALVIIVNGKHGSGFSMQAWGPPVALAGISDNISGVLRTVADQIDADMAVFKPSSRRQ